MEASALGACSVLLPADTGYGPRYIHLLGGAGAGTTEPSYSHYRLDAWYGTGWQEMPDMLEARDNFGCVATSQGIFVTGGQDAANNYKSSVELYSFLMDMWEPMAALEVARAYHAMGLVGDNLPAILGGATSDVLVLQEGGWRDPGFSLNRAKI